MLEIIPETPVGVAMELTGRNPADADVSGLLGASCLTPGNADFSGKLGDVFMVFEIGPKFDLGARSRFYNFTNYGDGWSDVTPGPPADY